MLLLVVRLLTVALCLGAMAYSFRGFIRFPRSRGIVNSSSAAVFLISWAMVSLQGMRLMFASMDDLQFEVSVGLVMMDVGLMVAIMHLRKVRNTPASEIALLLDHIGPALAIAELHSVDPEVADRLADQARAEYVKIRIGGASGGLHGN